MVLRSLLVSLEKWKKAMNCRKRWDMNCSRRCKRWPEWTSSHQCTSCRWARWGRFPNERKSHPPCPHFFFFFHLFSTPKFSPLLPTTYQPLPPSLHHQSSRDVERERAWSRGAARAHSRPTRDPGKHLTFCIPWLICLFVCGATLHKMTLRYNAAPQSSSLCCKKKRRRRRRWQQCLLLLLCAAQEKEEEEGDGSSRRLLLLAVEFRSSMKKAMAAMLPSPSSSSSCCKKKEEEEGDDSCRHLLLSALELRCNVAPWRRRR